MASLELAEAVKSLKNPKFTDFVIKCGDDASFHVHKFLISAKSEFLAACVEGSFREGIENELIVKETTPLAVASIIYYIYAGMYSIKAVVGIWPDLQPFEADPSSDQSLEEKFSKLRARQMVEMSATLISIGSQTDS